MGRSERDLQAVVLCDTYLPRFAPLTEEKPRCLLPLANMPLIEYTLEFLVNCGISEVYLMCCSHANQISQYIKSSKWSSSFVPFKLQTIELPNSMSIGDAMRDIDARGIITSDFLLISGDVVCNINFDQIWDAHVERKKQDKNCIMSMVLRQASAFHRTRSSRTGMFIVDNSTSRLVAYHKSILQKEVDIDASELLKLNEVSFRNDLIDCRIDICTMDVPALFTENFDYEYLRDDFVRGVLNSDLLGKTIYAHIIDDGYAARVESIKTYKAVTKDIVSRYAYPLVVDRNELPDQSYRYQRGHIYKEKDVGLSQSCSIGMDTVIGGQTTVGQKSTLQRTCLGRRCTIGNGVIIEESYIFDDVIIHDNVRIEGALIGNGVVVGENTVIEPGSVIGFGVQIAANTTIPRGSKLSALGKHSRRKGSHSSAVSDASYAAAESVQSDESSEDDAGIDTDNYSSENEDLAALVDDMYLSDSSFSSVDDKARSSAGVNKNSRRKGRTMSSTSNYSFDDEEDSDEFMKEAIASINRSIVDKHSQDVAILELNTLRMTMNAPHEKVQEAAVTALITHIGHLITQADVKTVTNTVFTTWTPLLRRITFDLVGQANLAVCIENSCAGLLQGNRVLFYALMTLYDTDVISEEAIYDWWKMPEASPKIRQLTAPWVDWLENAEEESDE